MWYNENENEGRRRNGSYSLVDDKMGSYESPSNKAPDYSQFTSNLNQQNYSMGIPPVDKPNMFSEQQIANAGTTGLMTMATTANPYIAAAAVGGQLIGGYMQQKAESDRQRRANAAQIANQHAQNQNSGFNTIMSGIQGALR